MPQRFVIFYSCSLCGTEFEGAAKVAPYTLTGGGAVRAYDICATCEAGDEAFVAFLAAGIKERPARKTPAGEAPEGRVPCDYCDEAFTSQGMSLHLSKMHNVKPKTAVKQEALGTGPLTCPECGFGAKAPQGLAVHRFHNHGVKGTTRNPDGSKKRRTMRA